MDLLAPIAFLFGLVVFVISIMPYRAKPLLHSLKYRSFIWYVIVVYETLMEALSYHYLLSFFSLAYSSIYLLARSENPYSSLLLFTSIAIEPLGIFRIYLLYISIILYLTGFFSASRGNYRMSRYEYVIEDEEKIEAIDESSALFVYPGKRMSYANESTRFFLWLFNVAYEPPNGLLVSLAMMVFSTLLYVLRKN